MKDRNKTLIGDAINSVLGIIIIVLVIIALFDLDNRIGMFPYIMLVGAVMNGITSYKMKSVGNNMWIVLMILTIILLVMALVLFMGVGGF